uniref:Uncharacterized protein n=1 Tax=Amphimedon queenslandica TaxID=400682 RepID=A0A1X7TMU2_AMPQE
MVPQTSWVSNLTPSKNSLVIGNDCRAGRSTTGHGSPLALWPISGNMTLTKAFQETLQTSFWHRGGKRPHSHTTPCSRNGSAGVLNGKII